MLKLYGGKEAEIESISIKESKPVTTYNIEVEDYHTYYVTQSDILCHNACTGSYDITFESGKHYVGKGSVNRMNKSANRISKKFGDKVVNKSWTSAKNSQIAFIDEYMKMSKYNFDFGGQLYNKIISPGFKYFEMML